MTLDGLLTFLTLLAAIYAIMPNANRLRFWLHFRILERALAVLSFFLVNYFEFYETADYLGYGLGVDWSSTKITPQEISYLVVVLSGLLFVILFSSKRITRKDLTKIHALIDELKSQGQWTDVIFLFSVSLAAIVRAYKSDFVRDRLIARYSRQSSFEKLLELAREPTREDRVSPWFRRFREVVTETEGRLLLGLARILPPTEKYAEAARSLVRMVLLSHETSSFIAVSKPYFALKVFTCNFYEVNDFVDIYLTKLISDHRSILYFELQNNQNTSSITGYEIDPLNRLLYFLFSDSKVAEKLSVWRPIGEFLLTGEGAASNDAISRFLNGPCEDFSREGRWRNPFFVGLRFFDVMISAALHQKIRWHMWLYYLPHFTSSLVKIYDLSADQVDPTDEWPTRTSYLLYEMFSMMKTWISVLRWVAVEDFPLESEFNTHENGNIPKSAILALGQCLNYIVSAPNIDEKFKSCIFGIVLDLYAEIDEMPSLRAYANVLRRALVGGGFYLGSREKSYAQDLLMLFDRQDVVLRGRAKGLRIALQEKAA